MECIQFTLKVSDDVSLEILKNKNAQWEVTARNKGGYTQVCFSDDDFKRVFAFAYVGFIRRLIETELKK